MEKPEPLPAAALIIQVINMADIFLSEVGNYYDISFENGDFKLTYGFDTALLMSILCEKRADVSEMPIPELRRGWWGNTVLDYENYEIGSKLWLLEQSRKDIPALNLAKTYSQEGLQWLITDNHAIKIDTDTAFSPQGIELEVNIVTSANKVLNKSYTLWINTNRF